MSQGGDVEMGVNDHDPLASWDQHVTLSAQSTNETSIELETYLSKLILSAAWIRFMILSQFWKGRPVLPIRLSRPESRSRLDQRRTRERRARFKIRSRPAHSHLEWQSLRS
ncbi:hypothetical protein C2845_PM06G22560 [Panicum miliaceum]|uniref:Uncharacterized protein n=1 Tax=Panicum miliaceum TaxID=4540 RepID=A0A3L6RCY0_PANMI|nr:hypothetical protein C2845_PM06G22560 [Panicum miliaceum]